MKFRANYKSRFQGATGHFVFVTYASGDTYFEALNDRPNRAQMHEVGQRGWDKIKQDTPPPTQGDE